MKRPKITKMLSRALVRTWRVPRRALSTAAVPLDQTDAAPKVMNFINGKFESSTTKKWIPLLSPATNKLVCWVPESTPDELRRAEEGALAAFKKWRDVPIQQRQVCFPFEICFIVDASAPDTSLPFSPPPSGSCSACSS
jgi:hypothetical protein